MAPPPYNSQTDYINRLHNHLSRLGQRDNFRWGMTTAGPNNNQTHTAQAILNGQVIATHTGNAKNVAKRYAAYYALVALDPSQLEP